MSREIRIYIEGSGKSIDGKRRARFRTAFNAFFKDIHEEARQRRIRLNPIPSGGREQTFRDYKKALNSHPDSINLLLIDSEGPILDPSPWRHLEKNSNGGCPHPGIGDNSCHLMVQMMESWFLADGERLKDYYGKGFNEKALPASHDIESISKEQVADLLKRATKATQKGEYHKTRHAPDILEKIRPDRVREKASYCKRLFSTLSELIRN
jgi:hypothetical protein